MHHRFVWTLLREEFCVRYVPGAALKDCGKSKDEIVPSSVAEDRWLQQSHDAFMDRKAPSYSEEQNANQQGPKIEFLAVPKGMCDIGRACTALLPQQEKQFVPGVDSGMKGFS